MNRLALSLMLCSATSALAASAGGRCDLPDVKWEGELQDVLQKRAVDAINSAASGADDSRIQKLTEPSATFSSGGGDVGIPLGEGISGIRALARHMSADTYRFFVWTFIPTSVSNPCGSREVEVEFINTTKQEVFPVKFSFLSGKIVSAVGWSRYFSTGSVKPVRN